MKKRIAAVAISAAAAVAFVLPATPASAHCVYFGTFPLVCTDANG